MNTDPSRAEDEILCKWKWHARCVDAADRAKARRDMKAWEDWSQRAAAVLQELA